MSMKTKDIIKFVLCFIVAFLFVEGCLGGCIAMELSNVVKGIIAFALSLLFFGMLFGDKKSKTSDSTTPKNETSGPTIDVSNILNEFNANALAAESKYEKLGVFIVRGKFTGFSRVSKPVHLKRSNVFLLRAVGSGWGYNDTVAILQEGYNRSDLEKLRKGSNESFKVRFSFLVSGHFTYPVFESAQ